MRNNEIPGASPHHVHVFIQKITFSEPGLVKYPQISKKIFFN